MEEKRIIKVNTDLFKIPDTRKNRKPKEQKEIKVKSAKTDNNKTLKRSLLRFLRNHQEQNLKQFNNSNEKIKQNEITDFNTDFKDSLEYLNKLTKENENNNLINPLHNKTIKQYTDYGISNRAGPLINTSVPIELTQNDFTNKITETIQSNTSIPNNYKHYPAPSYGCLKNGTLPTFRTWKNHTQKNNKPSVYNYTSSHIINGGNRTDLNNIQTVTSNQNASHAQLSNNSIVTSPIILNNNNNNNNNNNSDAIQKSIMKQMMNKMTNINNFKNEKNNKFQKKQKKTLRRTYNVGKSKIYPKISVLVSNKTIRKNITTKSQLLKQVPIQEIKKYLIKKGFIKVGSIAPNDVLRKMYETSILMCGEIQNHNPENLLYNYFHDKEE